MSMSTETDVTEISDLPDDVIIEILSQLSAIQIMRLIVLSKRWRKVCSSIRTIPCLNLNVRKDGLHWLRLDDDASLKKFASTVLHPYNTSNLHTFRLISDTTHGAGTVDSFSVEVGKLINPRIVYADVPVHYGYTISSIFTWKSIEELYLRTSLYYSIFSSRKSPTSDVTLPNLKKMQLTEVVINSTMMSSILSGCPVIEELSLKNCHMSGCFSISHRTLKHFSLESCNPARLSMSAPNLVSLEYVDGSNFDTTLTNLPSLVSARVNCLFPEYIIGSLSTVQQLDLGGGQLKYALAELEPLRFNNMKSLALDGCCMVCEWSSVACFLERAPNLEELKVRLNMTHCHVKKGKNHCNVKKIEASRCKRLKKIEVRVSKQYKRAYGSGMGFLILLKETEPEQIVLNNRVWIRKY